MGRPRAELSEKHWNALKLIEEGSLNFKEIANLIGWGEDYFCDLRSGNIERAGYTAELFARELKKAETKRDNNTRALIKENTAVAQELIKSALADLKAKKVMTHEDKKLLGTLTNCLSKCTPSVSADSLEDNRYKRMTLEEIIMEYTRLTAIAEQSFINKKKFEEGRPNDE